MSAETIYGTPLSGDATHTGDWLQSPKPDVMVSCTANVAGTLYFDFSNDGGATSSTFPVNGFDVAAGVHEFHTALKGPRWFRIRYVNGSTAQSSFQVAVYFGNFSKIPNAPLNQTIGADADATIVRTVDSSIDLEFGRFSGMEAGVMFGEVQALDAADGASDVWAFGSDDINAGGLTKTFPTAAQSLYISSDSASDTDVDVLVTYIDSTGATSTITPNLNGQTAVDMGVTGFDAFFEVTGDTAAVGNIYLNTANAHTAGVPNTPSTVLAFSRAAYGQTQLCGFTVPLGKQLAIDFGNISIARGNGSAGSSQIDLRTRAFGETWIVRRAWHITTQSGLNMPLGGLLFPARTSIIMRVRDVSDSDTNITAALHYKMIDD